MTKADLVEAIADATGLSKKDTGVVVDRILENISRALCDGDKVELRGFGSFKVKERRSRKARNPRTGDAVEVPAKLVPYFKASNELKTQVDEAHQGPAGEEQKPGGDGGERPMGAPPLDTPTDI